MDPDSKIRIVIAEDHKLFCEGLRLILSNYGNFEIVGEVTNGLQAIDVISDLQPDVILLDIALPDLNGIEVIPIIKEKSPGTKALMLTVSEDEDAILKVLKAGAKGYLSKNTDASDLIKAIQVVCNGELWVERKLVTKFFDKDMTAHSDSKDRQKTALETLTYREHDVLRSLIRGATNKEIAHELFISEKTVKSHLNKVFKKLNVSRRLEAILCAIKSGLT